MVANQPITESMKIKALIIFVLLLLIHFIARADGIYGYITNSVGQADNTPAKITPLSSYVTAGGVYYSRALPFWIYPSNGYFETNLSFGYYSISNASIVSTLWPWQGGTSQGYIFQVVGSGQAYPFTTYPLSGYNVYNSVLGIIGVVLINGFSGYVSNNILYLNGSNFTATITYGGITNALGFLPIASSVVSNLVYGVGMANSNNEAQIGLNNTNFTLLIGQNGTNYGNTVGFALSNIINQAWSFMYANSNYQTNLTYQVSVNLSNNTSSSNVFYEQQFTLLSAAITNQSKIAASGATNGLGTAAFQSVGAFDAAGSAQAATQNLGSASLLSSNFFDWKGSAQSATAGLTGPLSAFVNTNQFASASSFQQATGNLGSAAWQPTSAFDAAGTAQKATNGLASTGYVAFAISPVAVSVTNATNGVWNFITQNYYQTSNPSQFITTSYVTSAIAPFVTASITNGLATTGYVASTVSPFTTTGYVNTAIAPISTNISNATNNLWNAATLNFYPTSNPEFFTTLGQVINLSSDIASNVYVANSNLTAQSYGQATNNSATNTAAQIQALSNRVLTNTVGLLASTGAIATSFSITNVFQVGTVTNLVLDTNNIAVRGTIYRGTYRGGPYSSTWTNVFNPALIIVQSGPVFYLQSNLISVVAFGQWLGQGVLVPPLVGTAPWAGFDATFFCDGVRFDGVMYSTNIATQVAQGVDMYAVPGYGLTNYFVGPTNIFTINTNIIAALILEYAISPTNGISAALATNIVLNYGGTLFEPIFSDTPITTLLYTNIQSMVPVQSGNTAWAYTNAGGGGSGGNVYSNSTTFFNAVETPLLQVPTTANINSNIIIGSSGPESGFANNNVAIGVAAPVWVQSEGGTWGNVSVAGNGGVTNLDQTSFTIGAPIYNPFSSDFIVNLGMPEVFSEAQNEMIIYPAGGLLILTNLNPGGFNANMNGSFNASALYVGGIPVLTNANASGIAPTNGTGYGTTLDAAYFVQTTNLIVTGISFLNSSNLNVSYGTNIPVLGVYSWGNVPPMTWSNVPSGLATASGSFASPGSQYTNAWGIFSTNQNAAVQVGFNPGQNNQILYNFAAPTVVDGDAIAWNDIGQQVSITFEGSPDNSTWTILGSQNQSGAIGMTNTFAPFAGQYFKWIVTNASGLAFGNSPWFTTLNPSAQIYGVNTFQTIFGTANNNINAASNSAISIVAPSGIGINTSNAPGMSVTVGGAMQAGSVQANDIASAQNIDAQSYSINGVQFNPTVLSSLTNGVTVTSYWITNGSGPATNFDGRYLPDGVYWTNTINGYAMVPVNSYGIFSNGLAASILNNGSSIFINYGNGVLPVPGSSILCTNVSTFLSGPLQTSGAYPAFIKQGSSLIGTWSPIIYGVPQNEQMQPPYPVVSVLTSTAATPSYSGSFIGNGVGLTNVTALSLVTGATVGSNAVLGQIGPWSLSVTGAVLSTKPPLINNSTFNPWIPFASVMAKAATNQAVVCVVGDSYAADNQVYSSWPRHFMQLLWGDFGCAGMALQPPTGTGNANYNVLWPYTNYWWGSSGFSDVNANDANQAFGSAWNPNASGTVENPSMSVNYQLGIGANIPANQLVLYYVAWPGGTNGYFYPYSLGGNYGVPVAFNGYSPTPIVEAVTNNQSLIYWYSFYPTNAAPPNGTLGTNIILGVEYRDTYANGIVYVNMGGNGPGTGGHLTLSYMNSISTNLQTEFFNLIHPDLVLYSKMDYGDPGATNPTCMYTNFCNIMNCFPSGTPIVATLEWPNADYGESVISGQMSTNNAILTAACQSNGWYCLDLASQYPNYAVNVSSGLLSPLDDLHPSWLGAISLATTAASLCHIPISPAVSIMDTGPGAIETTPYEIVAPQNNGTGYGLWGNGNALHFTNVMTATGSNWMFYPGN
jgi:hypothetical protein